MTEPNTTGGLDWDAIQRQFKQTNPQPSPYFSQPCPSCGYCQHCGRGYQWGRPAPWSSPFYVTGVSGTAWLTASDNVSCHERVGGVIE